MATYKSLEQIQATREKRQGVFEKARGMREAGQISEAEFQLLKKKFDEKMAALDRAEADLRAADPSLAAPAEPEPPPPDPEAETPVPGEPAAPPVQTDEVLGMARDILGSGETPPEVAEAEPPVAEDEDPLAITMPAMGMEPSPDLTPDPGATAPSPDPDQMIKLPSDPAPDLQAVAGILAGIDPSDALTAPPAGDAELDISAPDGDLEVSDDADASGGFTASDLAGLASEEPPAGLVELTVEDEAPAVDTTPTDPGTPLISTTGDADLLSLVRGGFGGGGDPGSSDLEGKLHSETVAREQAEKRASAKEREATEMHEAFRRAVDEKDRMGVKLLDVRKSNKKIRKWLHAATVIATAGVLGAGLLFLRYNDVGTQLSSLKKTGQELKNQRQKAMQQLEELRTSTEPLRKSEKKARNAAKKLAGALRKANQDKKELREELEEARGKITELEEAVEAGGLPGAGSTGVVASGGGFQPDPARDEDLARLLALRGADLQAGRTEFLESVRGEFDDLDGLLEELGARLEAGRAGARDEALDQLLRGRARSAVEKLEKALARTEHTGGVVRRVLAAVYLNQGDHGGATRVLEAVSGDGVEAQQARRTLVSAYRKLRRYSEAREVLQKVLGSPHATTDDYLQAGILADMAEDRVAARDAYLKVYQQDPENARAISLLSSLAIERQDWGKARTYLEKAVARSPEDPDLQYNLALALIGLGETGEARPLVEGLTRRGWPGSAELAARLGDDGSTPEPAPDGGGGDGGAPPAPDGGGDSGGGDGSG